jgi:hypothetical protein
MTGSGDEMSVSRVDVEVIKAFIASEGIGHGTAHAGADLSQNFI